MIKHQNNTNESILSGYLLTGNVCFLKKKHMDSELRSLIN